jgi:hypothetical protein
LRVSISCELSICILIGTEADRGHPVVIINDPLDV